MSQLSNHPLMPLARRAAHESISYNLGVDDAIADDVDVRFAEPHEVEALTDRLWGDTFVRVEFLAMDDDTVAFVSSYRDEPQEPVSIVIDDAVFDWSEIEMEAAA